MSIQDVMRAGLRASVGNGAKNREDDVKNIKNRLTQIGRMEKEKPEPNGYITKDMDNAIQGFQKDMGLKVDGAMKPRGETEIMLGIVEGEWDWLRKKPGPSKKKPKSIPPLGGSVGGHNKTNQGNDVKAVQTLLALVGLHPKAKEVMPSGILDASDDMAIKAFQQQNGLKVDGVLNPKGETEETLRQLAKAKNKEDKSEKGIDAFQKRRTAQKSEEEKKAQTDLETTREQSRDDDSSRKTVLEKMAKAKGLKSEQDITKEKKDAQLIHNKWNERANRLITAKFALENAPTLTSHQKMASVAAETLTGKGVPLSAIALKRYLSGKGGVQEFDSRIIREDRAVQKAERVNEKRFSDDVIDPNSKLSKALNEIKNGETITILDKYDRGINYRNESSHLHHGELDSALAFGQSELGSVLEIEASRKADKIIITGHIDYEFEDTYDFHEGRSGAHDMLKLEKAGLAKPYDVRSSWKKPISGHIPVINGKLGEPVWEIGDVE